MTVPTAKRHLRVMLRDFTLGSVLHLLAEVLTEDADSADPARADQIATAAKALLVLGLGLDAALPHRRSPEMP